MPRTPSTTIALTRARLALVVGLALPSPAASSALADPPRVIVLDAELRPVRGTLAGVTAEGVRVRESRSRVRTIERAALIVFEPAQRAKPETLEAETPLTDGDEQVPPASGDAEPARPTSVPAPGILELTDGQRWPGSLAQASGESLTWRGPAGTRSVPLDRVRRWTLVPGIAHAQPAPPASGDVVVLVNKDRLEGFIAGIDSAAGTLTLERRGKEEPLRLESLALVEPASKPDAPAPEGAMVWLRGEGAAIVAATDARADGQGRLTFAGTALGTLDPASVSALRLRPTLIPLADLRTPVPGASRASEPTGPWQPEPILRGEGPAADIELLGPGQWTWTLPPGSSRLSATVALAPEATAWGGARVTIQSADQRWTGELSGPALERDAVLEVSGTLIVTLESGPSGPAGARVLLRRAVVDAAR